VSIKQIRGGRVSMGDDTLKLIRRAINNVNEAQEYFLKLAKAKDKLEGGTEAREHLRTLYRVARVGLKLMEDRRQWENNENGALDSLESLENRYGKDHDDDKDDDKDNEWP
jgi:hypothetical protein